MTSFQNTTSKRSNVFKLKAKFLNAFPPGTSMQNSSGNKVSRKGVREEEERRKKRDEE